MELAIEIYACLIATAMLGQPKQEDVEEVAQLLKEFAQRMVLPQSQEGQALSDEQIVDACTMLVAADLKDRQAEVSRFRALFAPQLAPPTEPISLQERVRPVGIIKNDPLVHGWHMQPLMPWEQIGLDTQLYIVTRAGDVS